MKDIWMDNIVIDNNIFSTQQQFVAKNMIQKNQQ